MSSASEPGNAEDPMDRGLFDPTGKGTLKKVPMSKKADDLFLGKKRLRRRDKIAPS